MAIEKNTKAVANAGVWYLPDELGYKPKRVTVQAGARGGLFSTHFGGKRRRVTVKGGVTKLGAYRIYRDEAEASAACGEKLRTLDDQSLYTWCAIMKPEDLSLMRLRNHPDKGAKAERRLYDAAQRAIQNKRRV